MANPNHWLSTLNRITEEEWAEALRLFPVRRSAQGIEAATAAETVELGSVHESPVVASGGDAPKTQGNQHHVT